MLPKMKLTVSQTTPSELKVVFDGCPVESSLWTLGRKWALLVIRNIALYRKQRFNEMLAITPGLTRRVLAMRLKELKRDGFIEVVEKGRNYSKWDLTEKGKDVLPVLMMLVRFGSKWYSERVFPDKMPRKLDEVFDRIYIDKIMGNELSVVPLLTRSRSKSPMRGNSARLKTCQSPSC
ncbi:MAG: helix-turn-helix transcriptional regulator [Nitrososphaerota archaeon]|nr:helix-turn-helix transcriptional regulator [Nitrososphaerota archaeon]